MPTLAVQRVTKTYAARSVRANDEVSLSVDGGTLLAVVGHNGAGKTTLLSQVIGVTRPDSGEITLDGASLVADPGLARRTASMMPQLHAPLTGVTPRQAVVAVARLRGASSRDARSAATRLFAALDIEEFADRAGEKLSGGVRRLASLAMTAVRAPTIVLVDEPTNDVDPVRRPMIWSVLRRLADDGRIVLVVTHNLHEVQQTMDRFVLMQRGRVLMDSTPATVAGALAPMTLTVHDARPGIEDSAPRCRDSVRRGADLELVVAPDQVVAVASWAVDLTRKALASSFALEPASLSRLYERVTRAG
ncbi:ABC transporter ATP-binding protein [Phycicoccus endophyticus]|uniref:ABC transporter ATP-binding protein n=1 Tax=Phycicoccus endophyticus TaxID=1690220 RepID=A0A7G9R387_9MICO|nr:ABC transporter ATP-binding protein [Phycicoccus endophyticus]NHI19804.1 ABC transporter ATP-binding protein [Phycicoccus endophyticus]QNN50062.1 ABC transporter ATP-binding protein [Phycicoccus endophyticus]